MPPQNVVAAAFERRSFMRGSNYRALTGKNLVFWTGDHVVTHGGSNAFSF